MLFNRTSLVWIAGATVILAAAAPGAHAQGLPTGAASLLLELGEQTVTKPTGTLPTRSPVNITLFYPQSGVDPDLPWVMMMNGANCYGQDYTYLLSQLASRGYLAVAPTQFHPPQQGIDLSRDQADQCDKGSFAAVTASLVNDIHSLLSSQTPLQIPPEASDAVRNLNQDSIVLVAHSYGGVAAVDMLAGACEEENPAKPLCANYTTITDSQGRNALKGAIAYEGYSDPGLTIPDGMFLTYMAGQYNNRTQERYEETDGNCTQYVELVAGNHYAITDWNPDTAPNQHVHTGGGCMQKAPCGAYNPSDDRNFMTTQEEQEERLHFMANYTDAMVRATVLDDQSAASFLLNDIADSPLVLTALVASSCLDDLI